MRFGTSVNGFLLLALAAQDYVIRCSEVQGEFCLVLVLGLLFVVSPASQPVPKQLGRATADPGSVDGQQLTPLLFSPQWRALAADRRSTFVPFTGQYLARGVPEGKSVVQIVISGTSCTR